MKLTYGVHQWFCMMTFLLRRVRNPAEKDSPRVRLIWRQNVCVDMRIIMLEVDGAGRVFVHLGGKRGSDAEDDRQDKQQLWKQTGALEFWRHEHDDCTYDVRYVQPEAFP